MLWRARGAIFNKWDVGSQLSRRRALTPAKHVSRVKPLNRWGVRVRYRPGGFCFTNEVPRQSTLRCQADLDPGELPLLHAEEFREGGPSPVLPDLLKPISPGGMSNADGVRPGFLPTLEYLKIGHAGFRAESTVRHIIALILASDD